MAMTHTRTHLHGDDAAWNELLELANGEVPGAHAHHVVERELDDETSLGHHLLCVTSSTHATANHVQAVLN